MGGLPSLAFVSEDSDPGSGPPRSGTNRVGVALAALGLLAGAAATMTVIKADIQAGGSATVADGPRRVVATAGPSSPEPPGANGPVVTVTVDPAAAAETPIRLPGTAGQPASDLRQIVYTVAGNQRPHDPVTVVYADESGTLQTLQNVTLPWSLAVTPELPVNYVTANSRGSQLNCWITVSGTTVVSDTEFGPSTTCNR